MRQQEPLQRQWFSVWNSFGYQNIFVNNIKKIIESKGKKAEKVYVYVLPKELELYKSLESEEIKIFSAADKNKYDPQNKAGKAKPGKPAIYLE